MSQKKSRFWAAAAAAAVLAGIPLPFAYAAAPITESMTLTADYAAEGTEPNAQGSGTSMHVSALYSDNASRTDPMVVDMNGHDLSLSANGDGGISSAIVVGGNQWIQIKNASDTAKLTLSASHPTDTKGSNGIYIGGNYANLTIDGAVDISNIKTEGRTGAVGINLQGGGSAGASGSGSEVVINGPLTIKNVESGIRKTATAPNSAGIKVTADGGKVTVNDQVDITGVKGAGLYTVGADTEISVGGGIITAAEDSDKTHLYSAARVDKGTININMKDKEAGTNASQITGDFFVTREYGKRVVEYSGGELVDFNNSGAINAAIVGKDSFWKGALTYYTDHTDYGTGGFTAYDGGDFTLYLKDGASWINERQGGITPDEEVRNTWKGSKVTHFYGGDTEESRSYVEQKDTNPLTFEDYSGHTAIFYAHDNKGTKTEDYTAGNTIIQKAAEGSAITLITDQSGMDTTNDAELTSVLQALAGKLMYSAYTEGDTKLTGTVQIASGLTASSIGQVVKSGEIAFGEGGKGSYVPGDVPNPPVQKTEFTTAITGSAETDTEYVDAGVTTDGLNYTFDKDSHIKVDGVGVRPKDGMVIDAADHTLSLETTGRAIQTFSAGTTTINAKLLQMHAVSADGGMKTVYVTKGTLNINGDVSINAEGQTDTQGFQLGNGANVTVNGNVSMKKDGGYGIDGTDGYEFMGKQGFFVQGGFAGGKGSKMTVNGNVDLNVNANGVHVNSNGSVFEAQGGAIELKKDDNGVGYAALRAQNGTIYFNVNKDRYGDVTGAAGHDVVIRGNVAATTTAVNDADAADGQYTTINLGLNTAASSLEGIIYNAYGPDGVTTEGEGNTFYGDINLWLQNGATWTNAAWGAVGGSGGHGGRDFDGSYVTNFHGGDSEADRGYIIASDTNQTTLASYSGWTTVIYAHNNDGTSETDYTAGNVLIQNAESNSGIIMSTDNANIDVNNTTQVAKVLNALAGKLTYEAYQYEKNLTGKVQIADGLTASSQVLTVGDITFTEEGKGSYVSSDIPTPPAEKTEFTTTLTGDAAKDTEYAGNIKDGVYTFTKDSTITVDDEDKTAENIGYYPAVGGVIGKDKDITIDASGKKLSIFAVVKDTEYPAPQSIGMNTNKTLTVTAGEVDIDASSAGSGAYGIYVNNGGTANITGNVNLQVHHTADGSAYGLYAYRDNASIIIDGNVTMKGDGEGDAAYGVSAAERGGYSSTKTYDAKGISTYGGMVNIKGNIDAVVKGTGIDARGNGTVTIAGGTILTPESEDDSFNVISAGGGTVNMGMTEDLTGANGRDVVLQGGIYATGTVNLGLGSKDSQLKGHIDNSDGTVNLFLQNGASWTNQIVSENKDAYSIFDGSHVTKLAGGADAEHAGVIVQRDAKDLTVDNYSGWTKVIYAHTNDGTDEAHYTAGDTIITAAAEGSGIILSTDNTGITMTDKDQVAKVLNALAGKLTYAGYANRHLTGKVEIADGLTASSQSLMVGDITFTDSGKGSYVASDVPTPPVEQTQTEFSDNITGKKQSVYVQAGVQKEDNSYVFTKDSTISVNQVTHMELKQESSVSEDYDVRSAAIGVETSVKSVAIDASGKTLTLKAGFDDKTTPPNQNPGILSNRSPVYGIDNSLGSAGVTVKVATLVIDADNSYQRDNPAIKEGAVYGIHTGSADGSSSVTVDGNAEISAHGYANVYGLAAEAHGSIHVTGDASMGKKGDDWGINHLIGGQPSGSLLYGYEPNIAGISAKGDHAVVTVDGKTTIASSGSGIAVRQGGTVNVGNTEITIRDNTGEGRYYYSVWSSFGTANVNMNEDGTAAGTDTVKLTGNIGVLSDELSQGYQGSQKTSAVNVGLSGADSSWTGAAVNEFTADQQKQGYNGEINLYLNDGAVWTNQKYGATVGEFDYGNGISYTGSHVTKLVGGADADHAGVIIQKDAKDLTVDNYSGWTKIVYAHAAAAGQADEETSFISAGDVVIGKAAEGSGVTLITDSLGLGSDKEKNDALAALARKLVYNDAGNNKNLTGKVALASGLTASDKEVYVGKENISFTEGGKGQMTAGGEAVPDKPVNPPVDPDKPSVDTDKITEGDYETFVMKGIRSAATTSFHAWRDNMTDFYDASEGADEDGIFAKAYGGKTEADVKGVHETNSYWGGQVGYDKALASGWHTGAAFDYRDGDSDYLLGGKGDDKLYSLGVYGQKTMADGSYVKVAAKAGRVENEYTVYNELRLKALKGDYKASAYGVTAEYGKTFGTGRAYVTPKVSLAWASVGSKDYTARAGSDTISIDQESYNSLVGRLGFEAGVEHARGGFYAGLAVAHEFDGDISARYNAADGGEKHTSFDGEDTWVELVLGGRYKLSDASQLYADFARDFGGDFEHQWKLNAGIRFSF